MQNPWFNPWFESIAVAQKRAKRRLPKSVYGALIAGAERGVTVIGTGGMYPEIENALVGLSAGDEKTVTVDFPTDWRVPQLAGKTTAVTVKIEQISEAAIDLYIGVADGHPRHRQRHQSRNDASG